jgi:hypothetical protein
MSEGFAERPTRPGRGGFEVAYEMDFEDLVALHLWLAEARGVVRGLPVLLGWIIAAVVAVIVGLGWGTFQAGLAGTAPLFSVLWPAFLLTGSGLFVLYLLFDPSGRVRACTRSFLAGMIRSSLRGRASAGAVRAELRVVLRLDADGMTEDTEWQDRQPGFRLTERKETVFAWDLVTEVAVTEEHVFVRVADKGFAVVPRRSFADEAELSEFLAALERYRPAPPRATE